MLPLSKSKAYKTRLSQARKPRSYQSIISGSKERTQPIAASQPTIVKDRIRAQSQAGSSASAHRGGQPGRPRTAARVYAMTQQQAQATPEVVTGILPISNADARVLIDLGATHSFVANSCHTFG